MANQRQVSARLFIMIPKAGMNATVNCILRINELLLGGIWRPRRRPVAEVVWVLFHSLRMDVSRRCGGDGVSIIVHGLDQQVAAGAEKVVSPVGIPLAPDPTTGRAHLLLMIYIREH